MTELELTTEPEGMTELGPVNELGERIELVLLNELENPIELTHANEALPHLTAGVRSRRPRGEGGAEQADRELSTRRTSRRPRLN